MATHKYERPWQVMPAKIIKLALEHANKDNDFDDQVAYLLLDTGVEAALKIYLINQKQDVEYIKFPELLKRVTEELSKSNPSLIPQLQDIEYLHKIRNKLYHQGDGVRPTEDNLKRYSDIAKKIIGEVIDVNIETEEKEYKLTLSGYNRKHKFEDLVAEIQEWLKYFHESCAIVTEKLRPIYETREFSIRLKDISYNYSDVEGDDPRVRVEIQNRRLEKYNELTGKEGKNHAFVDFILEDVNHLFVIIALQEISDNVEDDWKTYINILEKESRLLSYWKYGVDNGHLSVDQIREEFEKTTSWLEIRQIKLSEWINAHIDNIYGEPRPFKLSDADSLFEDIS